MATIEELVEELNELCKQYIVQKEDFKGTDRFQQLLIEIQGKGYNIEIPSLELVEPVYELLSDEGKKDFDEMLKVRNLKIDAVERHEFERAADLRDIERKLLFKIKMDFSLNTDNQHFILAGKMSDLILFNDPDNILIALIK
jgi:hypothetical protein